MNPEAAPASGLPDIAAMLVIMDRHGARACEYTRVLASALSDSGRGDEAEAVRLMTATIMRCQEAIALRKKDDRAVASPKLPFKKIRRRRFDPELGAACNRLAAFVEPLPEGVLIDATTRLTERDLALILRRLYDTRHSERSDDRSDEAATSCIGHASIPITASRTTR